MDTLRGRMVTDALRLSWYIYTHALRARLVYIPRKEDKYTGLTKTGRVGEGLKH